MSLLDCLTTSSTQSLISGKDFTPLDVPILKRNMWLDATDKNTVIENIPNPNQVESWKDKYNNNDVSQFTASSQPITNVRKQNGLNVLDFNGGSHFLGRDPFLLPSTCTIFFVGVSDIVSDSFDSLYSYDAVSADFQVDSGNIADFRYRITNTQHSAISDTVNHEGEFNVYTYILDLPNNKAEIYINNVLKASTNDYNVTISATGNFRIGLNRAGTLEADIAVGELVILNAAASLKSRTDFQKYFSTKWAI